jgi:ABC-type nitrate/sulfonate/bicarbonate transport system substrate-binding protein
MFDGRYQIALASIDNVVAYQEGQGEAKIPDNPDLFAFFGGDSGLLSIVGAPAIKSIADLKGKTLSVDAMTNGLAFVLRELVIRGGVAEADVNYVRAGGTVNRYRELLAGKHEATLLRTPFEILAKERGLNLLATAETLGPYQGTVGIARKSWAAGNDAAMVGFIRAYKSALDWIYDRANREIVEALLIANVRDMTPALAKQVVRRAARRQGRPDPRRGARHGGNPHGARPAQQVRDSAKDTDRPGPVHRCRLPSERHRRRSSPNHDRAAQTANRRDA